MSILLYPYKKGLNSTKHLREAGCKVRYATSRVRQGVAMAWGNSTPPAWSDRVRWINHPKGIPQVADKLRWAETGLGPEYTTDPEVAKEWASVKGEKVMCRTITNGSGGAGIVVARNPDQVVLAPFYTRYFRKTREYRVVYSEHTGVVYAASKRLRTNVSLDLDSLLIRTKDNGFVYQMEHDEIPQAVLSATWAASVVLSSPYYGLNLLGYDVAYNAETDEALVIEANSAFGLNEHSGQLVCDALEKLMEVAV